VFRDPAATRTRGAARIDSRVGRPRVAPARGDRGRAASLLRRRRLPVRAALPAPVRALLDPPGARAAHLGDRLDACHLDPAVRPFAAAEVCGMSSGRRLDGARQGAKVPGLPVRSGWRAVEGREIVKPFRAASKTSCTPSTASRSTVRRGRDARHRRRVRLREVDAGACWCGFTNRRADGPVPRRRHHEAVRDGSAAVPARDADDFPGFPYASLNPRKRSARCLRPVSRSTARAPRGDAPAGARTCRGRRSLADHVNAIRRFSGGRDSATRPETGSSLTDQLGLSATQPGSPTRRCRCPPENSCG